MNVVRLRDFVRWAEDECITLPQAFPDGERRDARPMVDLPKLPFSKATLWRKGRRERFRSQ